jgi:hypothetical protein
VIDISPTCPACGVPVHDAELHKRFHDGLRELARLAEAPDSTPEEYEQAIREQLARDGVP